MDNASIADRLEVFALLLELANANPDPPRAYRRAAETIRRARRSPSTGWCGLGRVRELRGIGPGIQGGGCGSSWRPARSPSSRKLERELSPSSSASAATSGSGRPAQLEIARALGVRTAGELREAAAAGRLRTVPGIGPKREAQLLDALAREGEPRPRSSS